MAVLEEGLGRLSGDITRMEDEILELEARREDHERDAARELSLDVWDAIALLAKEDEYPLNGLLDEDRFQLLKRAARKGADSPAKDKADDKTAIYPPPG